MLDKVQVRIIKPRREVLQDVAKKLYEQLASTSGSKRPLRSNELELNCVPKNTACLSSWQINRGTLSSRAFNAFISSHI
jgi:hypothetical protein